VIRWAASPKQQKKNDAYMQKEQQKVCTIGKKFVPLQPEIVFNNNLTTK